MDGWINLFHLVLYFYIIRDYLKGRDWVLFLSLFVCSGLINTLVAFYQRLFLAQDHNYVFTGLVGNTAYLAAYSLLTGLLAVYLFLKTSNQWLRCFYGSAVSLNFIILVLTGSRAGMAGLLIGVFSLTFLNIRNFKYSFLTLLVLVSLIFVSTDIFSMSELKAKLFRSETIKWRLLNWQIAWEGIQERPLLGWGQENFEVVNAKYYNPELKDLETWADNPHNTYLQVLLESGIIGFSLYLAIIVGAFKALRKFVLKERMALTMFLIAFLVHNIFMFNSLNTNLIFFGVLAYLDA